MAGIKYTCIKVAAGTDAASLKPNEDGTYTVTLGEFDSVTEAGEVYPFDAVKHLFKRSSTFMKRILGGYLDGELGHPKRVPGQTMESFLDRNAGIWETNTAVKILDATPEERTDKTGRKYVRIVGRIKPSGIHAAVLERALKDKLENVAFSIRCFTEDVWVGGVKHRRVVEIITWDYVNAPGIARANKYDDIALGMESISSTPISRDVFVGDSDELTKTGLALESQGVDLTRIRKLLGPRVAVKEDSRTW